MNSSWKWETDLIKTASKLIFRFNWGKVLCKNMSNEGWMSKKNALKLQGPKSYFYKNQNCISHSMLDAFVIFYLLFWYIS